MKKLFLTLGLVASIAGAKDTIGKLGVGGNTTLGQVSGLNIVYQSSKMLIWDLTLGANYFSPGASNQDEVFNYGVAAHAFLNFADYQMANFLIGAGVNVGGDDAADTEGVDFSVEVPLRLVWHANEHLAVFTQTGVTMDFTQDRPEGADNDFRIGIRTDLLGQAGVTFFF